MKRLLILTMILLSTNSYAATKNVVPRADGEGGIGTTTKRWSAVRADQFENNASCLGVDSDRFYGDKDCGGSKGAGEEYIDQAGISYIDSNGFAATLNNETGSGSVVFQSGATMTGLTVGTSIIIPNGASPTVDAAGKIAIDTSDDQLAYYGGAKRIIPYKKGFGFNKASPSATTDTGIVVFQTLQGITLTNISCIIDPTQNNPSNTVVVDLKECDSTADNCVVTQSAPMQCVPGGATSTTFSNATIDANDYIVAVVNAVTGTISQVNMNVKYTVDAQ